MDIAQQLIGAFERMVRSDGGTLTVLSAESSDIRIGYAPGFDIECETGACVLPNVELEQMMREWLSRRDPSATVSVQLVSKASA